MAWRRGSTRRRGKRRWRGSGRAARLGPQLRAARRAERSERARQQLLLPARHAERRQQVLLARARRQPPLARALRVADGQPEERGDEEHDDEEAREEGALVEHPRRQREAERHALVPVRAAVLGVVARRLRVRQHGVRLDDRGEACLGCRVVARLVWVVRSRHLAVRRLDGRLLADHVAQLRRAPRAAANTCVQLERFVRIERRDDGGMPSQRLLEQQRLDAQEREEDGVPT